MNTINKTKFALASTIIFILAVGCHASSSGDQSERRLAPLAIYGVSPGATSSSVVEKMGEPLKKEELSGFIVKKYTYNEVVIGFDDSETVASVEAKSKKACLLAGICLGSKTEEIIDDLERNKYMFEVAADALIVNGDGCWGEVTLLKGAAQNIRIRCSP